MQRFQFIESITLPKALVVIGVRETRIKSSVRPEPVEGLCYGLIVIDLIRVSLVIEGEVEQQGDAVDNPDIRDDSCEHSTENAEDQLHEDVFERPEESHTGYIRQRL